MLDQRTEATERPQDLGPHPKCRRCKGTGECSNAQFRCPCRWSTSPYREDAERLSPQPASTPAVPMGLIGELEKLIEKWRVTAYPLDFGEGVPAMRWTVDTRHGIARILEARKGDAMGTVIEDGLSPHHARRIVIAHNLVVDSLNEEIGYARKSCEAFDEWAKRMTKTRA